MNQEISHPPKEKSAQSFKTKLIITLRRALDPNRNKDRYTRKKESFKEIETPGFSILEAINKTKGTLIEVGGPTEDGYSSLGVELDKLDRKVEITNSRPANQGTKKVDARWLPYAKNSLGVIFSSALYENAYCWLFLGASKCLEKGGLLVMQHITFQILENAIEMGFTPKVIKLANRWKKDRGSFETYHVILQK